MVKVIQVILVNGYFQKEVKNFKEYEKIKKEIITTDKAFYDLYKSCTFAIKNVVSIEYLEVDKKGDES